MNLFTRTTATEKATRKVERQAAREAKLEERRARLAELEAEREAERKLRGEAAQERVRQLNAIPANQAKARKNLERTSRALLFGRGNVVIELNGLGEIKITRGLGSAKRHRIDATTSATVDTAGNLASRLSATRTAAGLVLAGPVGAIIGALARKKVDKRELYLLIEAAEWAEIIELKPKQGTAARGFAQKVNLAAHQAS